MFIKNISVMNRDRQSFIRFFLYSTVGVFLSILIGGALALWGSSFFVVLLLIMSPFIGLKFFEKTFFVGYLCFSFFTPSYTVIDIVTLLYIFYYSLYLLMNSQLIIALRAMPKIWFILLSFIFIWALLSVFYFENSYKFIYRDLRVFIYYLLLIPIYAIFFIDKKDKENNLLCFDVKIRKLSISILSFSLIICVITIVQVMTGVSLVQTGYVSDLNNISSTSIDVMRVQIPGFPLVMFSIVIITSFLITSKDLIQRILTLIVLSFLIIGMIFNYGRGLWVWTFISLGILCLCYGYQVFIRFIFTSFSAILILIVLGNVFNLHVVDVIIERFVSITGEGGGSTSLGWRQFEIDLGINKLVQTNFIGVGLGGEYRPPLRMLAKWEDYTRYTHNTYLFITLKCSLLGLILYGIYILKHLKTVKDIFDENLFCLSTCSLLKSVFSFLIGFSGLLITQPEIMTHYGSTLLTFCTAIIFMAHMHYKSQTNVGRDL